MTNFEVAKRSVCIVGGGLVGSLTAVYFASNGWNVHLLEKREDPRYSNSTAGNRSINLALSHRGISALKKVGLNLDVRVLEKVIPMKGRMIHDLQGNQSSQPYGKEGQHINSVDRSLLNRTLIEEADKFDNIWFHFEVAIQKIDLDEGKIIYAEKDNSSLKELRVDLIVGTDGTYSLVRNSIMKKLNMNYAQEYIEHAYCELTIPPEIDEHGKPQFKMNPNHLHIWPRHTYMMIALPNLDKSFTCTLFAPKDIFDSIKDESQLLNLFKKDLADSIPLIGWENLKKEYFANPKGSLMTIKCKPYNYLGKAILLGDSAHCMVPFYGQGMNCGFEDVETLFHLLSAYQLSTPSPTLSTGQFEKQMKACLDEYTELRVKNAHSICDLALHNYIEMRSDVASPLFVFKKKIMATLHRFFPNSIIPLYTMVSFSSIPYSTAMSRWKFQSKVLDYVLKFITAGALFSIAYFTRRSLFRIAGVTSTPPPQTLVSPSLPAILGGVVPASKELAEWSIKSAGELTDSITQVIGSLWRN